MIEKKDVFRYGVLILILISLTFLLMFFRGNPTGFAVFEDSGSDFDLGEYENTEYNNGIVLSSGISGNYTSQIFDAGNSAVWNNLSYNADFQNLEKLFCTDGGGDVYYSDDLGFNWTLYEEDYGRTATTDMFSNSDYLFILSSIGNEVWNSTGKNNFSVVYNGFSSSPYVGDSNGEDLYVAIGPGEIYKSDDNGLNWNLKGDCNPGTQNPKGISIDSNGYIYVVDGIGDVYKSINDGVEWTKVNDGYGGSTATDGMDEDSNDNLYILLNTELYKSDDSGENWSVINDSISPYANTLVKILIDNNDNFFILDALGRVFKSEDYGISWLEIGDCNNDNTNDPKGITNFIYNTSLSFYARTCDDSECLGEDWVLINDFLNLGLNNNRYFQYKVEFLSEDSSITPKLNNVNINYDLLNSAPIINIIEPQEGTTYGYNESIALNFSVSDSDDNLNSCWYNLGGENITINNCENISFDVSGNGNYELIIYANDTEGEENYDLVSFSVQLGAPTINLYYPINIYLNDNEVEFNYTPNDIDLDSCELWLDNGLWHLNQTNNNPINGVINNFNLNLSDKEYKWNIKCFDEIGNFAFNGNKTFYVDTITPLINLTQPNGVKKSREITASWEISDLTPVSCVYNVKQGASFEIVNTSINCDENINFNVSTDADFVFNLYVNDSAGNFGFESIPFSVDTSTSSTPITNVNTNNGGGGGGGGYYPADLGKLEISELGELLVYEGDNKTLSLDIKNIGSVFLNKCKLNPKGEISSWIYSTQIEGIAPGENKEFVFSLNVPEEISPGTYKGNLEIKCLEKNFNNSITLTIPGLDYIRLGEINYEKGILNINYSLDNSRLIGESVVLDIWVTDENENEIKSIQKEIDLNKEIVSDSLSIDLGDLSGVYYLYMAISSNHENFIRKQMVLGNSGTTGFAILNNFRGKFIGYVIFIIVIGIAVFFIVKRHGKKENHKNKHKWLLRKK